MTRGDNFLVLQATHLLPRPYIPTKSYQNISYSIRVRQCTIIVIIERTWNNKTSVNFLSRDSTKFYQIMLIFSNDFLVIVRTYII